MDQLEASLRAPSRALVGGDSVALFRAPEGLALARCLPKCSAQRGLGPNDSLNMRLMGPSAQWWLGAGAGPPRGQGPKAFPWKVNSWKGTGPCEAAKASQRSALRGCRRWRRTTARPSCRCETATYGPWQNHTHWEVPLHGRLFA